MIYVFFLFNCEKHYVLTYVVHVNFYSNPSTIENFKEWGLFYVESYIENVLKISDGHNIWYNSKFDTQLTLFNRYWRDLSSEPDLNVVE